MDTPSHDDTEVFLSQFSEPVVPSRVLFSARRVSQSPVLSDFRQDVGGGGGGGGFGIRVWIRRRSCRPRWSRHLYCPGGTFNTPCRYIIRLRADKSCLVHINTPFQSIIGHHHQPNTFILIRLPFTGCRLSVVGLICLPVPFG